MRTFTLALVAIAAMGLATSALAQQDVNAPSQQPNIPQGSGEFLNNGSGVATSPDASYRTRLAMLQRATARQTHEDGGRLTPAHEASFQKELDALNRHFKVTAASR